MKTCIFCQLATHSALAQTTQDFQRCVPRILNFLMECYIGAYGMLLLRCGKYDRISH